MKTLISVPELQALLGGTRPLVMLDCGFDLSRPDAGQRAWQHGHLPGEHYLHLDEHLSGPKVDAAGIFRGRHPLPNRSALAQTLGACGITRESMVVCYDDQGGPYAARAWWLLRWMGHDDVAVLDGGKAAWLASGGPLETLTPSGSTSARYPDVAPLMPAVEAAALMAHLGAWRLVDARAGERFRGEVEPLDAAAGHIPGARNRFFKDNLAADGRFASPSELRAAWSPLLTGCPEIVHYCGSGVTACHNILAVAHAGLGLGTLYPGSWSEWSADPSRPQAQG